MVDAIDRLSDPALDLILREARTYSQWKTDTVDDALVRQVYDLVKYGPTSANCCPMRVVFVKSDAAKQKLKPFLDQGNVDKTMSAPVTAIFGADMAFYDRLPELFPHTDAKSWFVGNEEKIKETAWRNATLQAGYFILSARALGLDCGPMSGFDRAGATAAFFAGTKVEANFLCNIGHGNPEGLHPRSPRLDFDEVCEIL